jgi:hypothetical protein
MLAVRRETRTIPIVFAYVSDPVGRGDTNRIRGLAQELVGLQPDIILTVGLSSVEDTEVEDANVARSPPARA